MKQENYHCAITVPISAQLAFDAVTARISEWWAKNIKGNAVHLHDIFTVYFGKTSGTFKIVDLVPGKRIVWFTADCYLDIFQNKQVWKDSTIVWEFTPVENATQITMTHIGLFPGVECFEDCRQGWDFYIKESLFRFLTAGKGFPGTGIRARMIIAGKLYEGVMFHKNDPIPDLSDGCLMIDVKEAAGEQVISASGVTLYKKNLFNISNLKGNYYMLLENPSDKDNVELLNELRRLL